MDLASLESWAIVASVVGGALVSTVAVVWGVAQRSKEGDLLATSLSESFRTHVQDTGKKFDRLEETLKSGLDSIASILLAQTRQGAQVEVLQREVDRLRDIAFPGAIR